MNIKTQTFIEKATAVHGSKYDYTKVDYVGLRHNVCIVCPTHGEFTQTPNNHIHGKNGCPSCVGLAKHTTSTFVSKAHAVHNHTYSYDNTLYTNNKTKVSITCSIHGDFLQTPSDHLMGYGCPSCAKSKNRFTTAEFVQLARKVHGNAYSYTKTQYTNNSTKVTITCPRHGDFMQTPNAHTSRGQGCKKCKTSKGENQIYTWLTNHGITNFIAEKTFDGCVSPKGVKLRFDFFIPTYNMLIEYDGEQHFAPVGFGRNMSAEEQQEKFELTMLHDTIKTKYAEDNKITLLRIRFDENVYEKLTSQFNQVPQSA